MNQGHYPRAGDPPDATLTHEPMPDWAFEAILKHLQSTVKDLKDWHWWRIAPAARNSPTPMYSISLSVIYPHYQKRVDTYEWSYEVDEPGIYLIHWRKAI